jgi:beta-galactosidase
MTMATQSKGGTTMIRMTRMKRMKRLVSTTLVASCTKTNPAVKKNSVMSLMFSGRCNAREVGPSAVIRSIPLHPSNLLHPSTEGPANPRRITPTRSNVTIALALVTVLGATAAHAQSSEVHPHLLAFTDTSSVRIELALPDAKELNGAKVHGRITSAADSNEKLWSGDLGTLIVAPDGTARLSARVAKLAPRRWSPQSPALYHLAVDAGEGASRRMERVRIGFRSVSSRNGQILLNGKPIFLRGNAINPPERNIPDSLDENRRFVEPYVRYLKSVGVNIIRLTRHSQVWFDVGDELGMMFFQGNYGSPEGGKATAAPTRPIAESIRWYRDTVLGPLVNHPSVVVYMLSNEQADKEIPYLTTGAAGVDRFLHQAYDSLHAWDASRLYIANAGYGFGRTGDLCDLHRYWGWYYNSFLSFYVMRDPNVCWRSGTVQPMTMTENTGNYTGVDGRYNLVPGTKQPDSQLNWTGHAPQSEQAERALAYQAWMAKQAIEIFRRTREQNPYLAGLSPFTILFHNWWGIGGFQDMKPKPIAEQYGVSYQPVLLSWELWTPQVYAGSTIRPVAHVVNDGDDGAALVRPTVTYALTDSAGVERLHGSVVFPDVPYYAAKSLPLSLHLPADLPAGNYELSGTVRRGDSVVSRNDVALFVARPDYAGSVPALDRRVALYDPSQHSRRAIERLGVKPAQVRDVGALSPARDLLVLGADAWDAALARQVPALKRFLARGGRMIVLHQDPATFDGSWLPAPIHLQASELDHSKVFPGGRPFRNGMAVNPERPDHPALAGIDRDRLFLWDDFTSWNETKPGFPQVYPVTRGFVLSDPSTLDRAAVLADYDHGLQGIALAELFDGAGSAIVTGFDLVDRSGVDPVADRLLANLLRYMGSTAPHEATQLVTRKIEWGDYASERGLLTGVYSGLLLNSVPVIPDGLKARYPVKVNAEGYALAGGSGGWNTKPAIQYVPHGRRPFGPYSFTSGGSVTATDRKAPGEGRVWLRIPDDRTTMITTLENPVSEPLELQIRVNGAVQQVRVPALQTLRVETPVRGGATPLSIGFRGDRRVVITETDFR